MKRKIKIWMLFIGLFLFSGCQQYLLHGVLYTNIKIPLTKNINNTPTLHTATPIQGKIIKLTEPFTGYGLYTEMYSNAIGDIAQKNGIQKIYFADQEIYNVLGIWSSTTIHVYGE